MFVLQFFEKAAENVKENVGDDIQTDQLIREACRNVLEHVRSLPVVWPLTQMVICSPVCMCLCGYHGFLCCHHQAKQLFPEGEVKRAGPEVAIKVGVLSLTNQIISSRS